MNKKITTLIILIFLCTVSADINANNNKYIDNRIVDFGVLPKSNKKVVAIFTLHNTGNKKIAISKSSVSCGCTTVKYPKQPINPNEKRKIYVDVRTLYKRGKFDESVLLRFTDGASVILHIRGIKDYYH